MTGHKHPNVTLAIEEVTLLAVVGGLVLWLLRLILAPASTLAGFRAWVLEECPTAPGRRADRLVSGVAAAASPRAISPPRRRGRRCGDTKSARFLALVTAKSVRHLARHLAIEQRSGKPVELRGFEP
jgi:hypothetical protein